MASVNVFFDGTSQLYCIYLYDIIVITLILSFNSDSHNHYSYTMHILYGITSTCLHSRQLIQYQTGQRFNWQGWNDTIQEVNKWHNCYFSWSNTKNKTQMPQQTNNSDCGVFICGYAKYLLALSKVHWHNHYAYNTNILILGSNIDQRHDGHRTFSMFNNASQTR